MTAVPLPRDLAQNVATFVSTMMVMATLRTQLLQDGLLAVTNPRIADPTITGKRAFRSTPKGRRTSFGTVIWPLAVILAVLNFTRIPYFSSVHLTF
jgi:hypothetical protein